MAWDDSGPYGHKTVRTPNLDKLASQWMRFDRAFLNARYCSPSRSSMITGRYPHKYRRTTVAMASATESNHFLRVAQEN